MTSSRPLALHRERIAPAWIDYNGHLNEAYYLLVFSHATDAFMDLIGLDEEGRRRGGTSLYTLETHVSYLQEVGAGAEVRVETQMLDLDEKRVHLFHSMYDLSERRLLCQAECLLLHVDMTGPRAAPFTPPVMERLRGIFQEHAQLPRPERAGRAVAIRRRVGRT